MAQDPWISGNPLPGVTFAYNSMVQIVAGPNAGEEGWLVGLELASDPIYTVELRSGGDVEVTQSMLRSPP